MNNVIIGKKGELIAFNYLKKKKYKIIQTNYKNKIGEIDLIALHKNTIIFIEVKLRNTLKFGEPRYAVTPYKQNKIKQTALVFLQQHFSDIPPIRFDVVEIIENKCNHIENAF